METVADLMSTELVTARAGTDLAVAFELMDDARIRHLPVVNDDGELIGLVSHRDLATRALGLVDELPQQEKRAVLAAQTVDTIMVRGPETCAPDDSLVEVAERLLENKFGCCPVVEGTRLVGIVTEADFVRLAVMNAEG
jgi:CBS domain-containing membrane protein